MIAYHALGSALPTLFSRHSLGCAKAHGAARCTRCRLGCDSQSVYVLVLNLRAKTPPTLRVLYTPTTVENNRTVQQHPREHGPWDKSQSRCSLNRGRHAQRSRSNLGNISPRDISINNTYICMIHRSVFTGGHTRRNRWL